MKPKCLPRDTWALSPQAPEWACNYLQAIRGLRRANAEAARVLSEECRRYGGLTRDQKAFAAVAAQRRAEALLARATRNYGPDVVGIVWRGAWHVVAAYRKPEWGAVVAYESLGWEEYRQDYRRSATFQDGTILEWGQNDERGRAARSLFGGQPDSVQVVRGVAQ